MKRKKNVQNETIVTNEKYLTRKYLKIQKRLYFRKKEKIQNLKSPK